MPHSLHFHKLYSFGWFFSLLCWFFPLCSFHSFIHFILCFSLSLFRFRMRRKHRHIKEEFQFRVQIVENRFAHTLRSSARRHCKLFHFLSRSLALSFSLPFSLVFSFACIFSVHAATAHKVHSGCVHCTHTQSVFETW